jgi:hypothetical protein
MSHVVPAQAEEVDTRHHEIGAKPSSLNNRVLSVLGFMEADAGDLHGAANPLSSFGVRVCEENRFCHGFPQALKFGRTPDGSDYRLPEGSS